MLGIANARFLTNLHITEYCMINFATFRDTELIKMIVNYPSGRSRNII